MIKYDEVKVGDILRIVPPGASGWAQAGDLVRVLEVRTNAVKVEDRDVETCEFVFNCGAARLEQTEWKQDFPADQKGT